MDSGNWRDAEAWIALSELTQRHRASGFPLASNGFLEAALANNKDGPLPPFLTLWLADNFAYAGQFSDAAKHYEKVVKRFGAVKFTGTRLGAHALRAQSYSYQRAGGLREASKSIERLLDQFAERETALDWYRLGHLAESSGNERTAAAMYKRAAGLKRPQERGGADVVDLANRDLERMSSARSWCRSAFEVLADELRGALDRKDGKALMALASPTHFTIGIKGSERRFSGHESAVRQLIRDLAESDTLVVPAAMGGQGQKRYVLSDGWRGEVFIGPVALLLTACPYGVEWSGIVITIIPPAWRARGEEQTEPSKLSSRARARRRDDDGYYPDWPERPRGDGPQPPPPAPAPAPPAPPPPAPPIVKSVAGLGLKSPWPAGMNLIAGGIIPFSAATLRIVTLAASTGPLFLPTLAALTLAEASLHPCGFGFGGLYYGWPPTHVGRDFFAVDFAHFLPFSPGIPITYGTPVLAVAAGIVMFVDDTNPTGSTALANEVHIGHFQTQADAFGAFLVALATGRPMDMYVSEYLHLDGPKRIPVSQGMFVRQGARLGVMDDTGLSAMDHLHFSLHDTALPDPTGYRWGRSVPPVPMDLQPVFDSECMFSTNMPIP